MTTTPPQRSKRRFKTWLILTLALLCGLVLSLGLRANQSERRGLELAAPLSERTDFEALIAGIPANLFPESWRTDATEALDLLDRSQPLWLGGSSPWSRDAHWERRFELALLTGDRARAAEFARQLYDSAPSDVAAFRFARLNALQGRKAATEEFLIEVLAAHPEYAQCRRELCLLYLSSERAPQAQALFEDRMQQAPEDLEARLDLALEFQARTGDFEAALETFRDAQAQANPDRLQGQQERQEAVDLWDRQLVAIARLLGPARRHQDAIDLLEEAYQANPELLQSRRELIFLYRNQQQLIKAEELYQKLLEQGDDPTVRLLLATDVLLFSGRLEEALNQIQRVFAEGAYPTDLAVDVDRAFAMLAPAFQQRQRATELVEIYEQVIATKPDLVQVVNALASLHLTLGNIDTASQVYETALEQNPKNAALRARYAFQVLLPQERPDDALKQLQQATVDSPEDALVWADLAVVHYQLNDLAAAVKAMERSLELAPLHLPSVQRIIELLDLSGRGEEANRYRTALPLLRGLAR